MSTHRDTTTQLQVAGFTVLAVVAIGLIVAVLSALGYPTLLLTGIGVAATLLIAATLAATYRWWGHSAAERKLRDTSALGDVTGKGAITKGAELRGLKDDQLKGLSARDVAMVIGRIGKKVIVKTLEDFTLIIMGPRSNKTSSQAVPRILSAMGAVVATSNKPDLWILTAALRRRKGPVYGYDPGQIAFVEQTWWWNILAAVTDFASAKRVATHFMAGVGSNDSGKGNSGFFDSGSKRMLAQNLLAAAVSGRTMRDVLHWIDTYSDEPVHLLKEHGFARHGEALDSTLHLVPETLSGIQGGASGALECLQDEAALRWVTPPDTWETPPEREITELDLWTLFTAHPGQEPTLYLMTQEGAESSGPIVAAMVDQVFKLADLASSAHGGRLEPPMTVVLDEAANICRIDDLPAKASHLGSKAVLVDVILQSYQQGMGVWGRERMGALWSASTCRIIGAGLQEEGDARMVSNLIGTHEVWKTSYSSGPGGNTRSRQLVREPIMPLEEVAAMDRSHALLIRQGSRPALMELMPWYLEDDATDISTYQKTATEQVRRSAVERLGDNALGQHLATHLTGTETQR